MERLKRRFILIAVVPLAVIILGALFAQWALAPRLGSDANDDLRGAPGPAVVAEGLTIPWDLAFLPEGGVLVTERSGSVIHVESGRSFPISGVVHRGEGGLLGIALHPDFEQNRFVYLYQTASAGGGLENRIVRYIYADEALAFDRIILSGIPGAAYHDGGRIEFGPDGLLYVTVGDAGMEDAAQERDSLAGSILRIRDDGSVPAENPFGTAVYSYGHRNPQGLAWDGEGRLWSTEHGRSGVLSGFDEINLIAAGGNYGWPDSQGNEVAPGTTGPVRHSGGRTWAPASAAILGNSLYFGGLRGKALYEAVLDGERIVEVKEHFKGEFGRIRTVRIGPDGFLYITTSNRDGRGQPAADDDRLIRIDPALLQ